MFFRHCQDILITVFSYFNGIVCSILNQEITARKMT